MPKKKKKKGTTWFTRTHLQRALVATAICFLSELLLMSIFTLQRYTDSELQKTSHSFLLIAKILLFAPTRNPLPSFQPNGDGNTDRSVRVRESWEKGHQLDKASQTFSKRDDHLMLIILDLRWSPNKSFLPCGIRMLLHNNMHSVQLSPALCTLQSSHTWVLINTNHNWN